MIEIRQGILIVDGRGKNEMEEKEEEEIIYIYIKFNNSYLIKRKKKY